MAMMTVMMATLVWKQGVTRVPSKPTFCTVLDCTLLCYTFPSCSVRCFVVFYLCYRYVTIESESTRSVIGRVYLSPISAPRTIGSVSARQ